MHRTLTALFIVASVLVGLGQPAGAHRDDATDTEIGVGFFYGTFGEHPNIVLLAGGAAEEFCESNPDDPFSAEPGVAPARIVERRNGTVDIRVNDRGQPIYLYYNEFDGTPPWIEQVCADLASGHPAPEPFASGSARLRVRDTIVSESLVYVFNSVRGRFVGSDGSKYRVRASADFTVEDGVPVGDPEDFVSFELTQINR